MTAPSLPLLFLRATASRTVARTKPPVPRLAAPRSPQRRAASTTTPTPPGANPLKNELLALLPPIPLYRRVLRANRRLPAEHRVLGDNYVKKEWRDHKGVENPVHLIGFLTQWQLYAQQVEGDSWREGKIDPMQLDKMSDEQIGQLWELKKQIEEDDGGGGL